MGCLRRYVVVMKPSDSRKLCWQTNLALSLSVSFYASRFLFMPRCSFSVAKDPSKCAVAEATSWNKDALDISSSAHLYSSGGISCVLPMQPHPMTGIADRSFEYVAFTANDMLYLRVPDLAATNRGPTQPDTYCTVL
ncbi:hypothetical protein CTA2_222 [Colletotrichum tanaceti]|nr:hypothetical protein CTA2_219 [Colletotrichum tanaceti]KAJ0167781.1 hypothetical protein CTA2_222 [Colletotrichum tanaceti]